MTGGGTDEASIDAFHRGAFHLVQPLRGHRAGMDAMMLAAAMPSSFAGRLADLGAGAGGAGLAVLARCPEAEAVLVERDAEMAGFARRTLALPDNAAIARRAALLVADVALAGAARREAGLDDRGFDAAIMNPPFNDTRDRQTPDALRKAAHVMEDGMFERWIRTAAAIVKPAGGLALIARPQSLAEILGALQGRFGALEMKPIHPRPEAAAIRIVLRGVRGSRKALALAPPLFLHEPGSDRFSAEADAINNGRASLFGD
jgi:tRNA1(Val) A37 N6-methylase TrmN6